MCRYFMGYTAVQKIGNQQFLVVGVQMGRCEKGVYLQQVNLNRESMGISGSEHGGTVPYKAIFCGVIPLHSPEK
jgi:hypothetical protein